MPEEKNDIYFYQGKNNRVNYEYQLSDILVEIETFLCKNIEKTENLCFFNRFRLLFKSYSINERNF